MGFDIGIGEDSEYGEIDEKGDLESDEDLVGKKLDDETLDDEDFDDDEIDSGQEEMQLEENEVDESMADEDDEENIEDDEEEVIESEDEETEEVADPKVESVPVAPVSGGKYIPPALRRENNALDRLIRGFLNRLSASNLYAISHEFDAIYRENPRAVVSSTIFKVILGQVVQPTQTPLSIVENYCCLLVILHATISSEISAFVIEETIRKYLEMRAKSTDDFALENLLTFVCCLTRLQLFKTKFVVEILEDLVSTFAMGDVKLIQTMLNSVAFTIRKEDPAALKSIILATHVKAREKGGELESEGGARVKFMIETLTNVKNNNLAATKNNPGFVDKERDDACRKRNGISSLII